MRRRVYRIFLSIMLMLSVVMLVEYAGMYKEEEERQREVSSRAIANELLIPGGMPIGIYMETEGVMVIGTEKVTDMNGQKCEPAAHIVKAGDYIVGIDEKAITSKKELLQEVERLADEEIILHLRRADEDLDVRLKPVQCGKDEFKLGIWIRDNTQGLGTVTFLTGNSEFGALGHGIHDSDTNELVEISKGRLYETSIQDIQKGTSGSPGGMEGVIVYNSRHVLGSIEKNTESGIYGRIDKVDELFENLEPMPAAPRDEIQTGDAYIRSAVDGTVKDYKIRITKIDLSSRERNKGIVLEVTDEKLLELTGGIVQGMSGSPIIQNGKIVGAVTHVFVRDSTKGYGIFIENMLKNV